MRDANFFLDPKSIPIEPIRWPLLADLGLQPLIRRDDLLTYSGNKYYKLAGCIKRARRLGCSTLVSCGGAFSNHLHALARYGHDTGFNTIGLVRGHPPKTLSPTLIDAKEWGMQLDFVPLKCYQSHILEYAKTFLNKSSYWIPEGGACLEGVQGCQALGQLIRDYFNGAPYTVCLPSATATTLAGIASVSPSNAHTLGVSVLKGPDRLTNTVASWLRSLKCHSTSWQVILGYHCGGYAKLNRDILDFIQRFERDSGLLIDPVYMAKLLFAIEQLAKRGYWAPGSNVMVVHTGGLQGRRGFSSLNIKHVHQIKH